MSIIGIDAITPLLARQSHIRLVSSRIDTIENAQVIFDELFKQQEIVIFKDKLGHNVIVGKEKLLNHLDKGQGGISRARFLPFTEDVIINPQEIRKELGRERYYYIVKYKTNGADRMVTFIGDKKEDKVEIFTLIPFPARVELKKRNNLKIVYPSQ